MKKVLSSIIAVIVCLLVFYVFAFSYLNYCDKPEKSETVVLFIGPGYHERLKEAEKLIENGYAKILVIPAYRELFTIVDGSLKKSRIFHNIPFNRKVYKRYFENTHIEELTAKQMMDTVGYTSAIFVSAPYHMRRIRIISASIFSTPNYRLAFIGSRYLQHGISLSVFKWSFMKRVCMEYVKICWFFIYKTEHGAMIGDLFMSLIHTCNLSGTNPFDYLTALLEHASELSESPDKWMP